MKNNWQTKKLGEICDFQNGFAFKSKMFKVDGFPILRISNIQNDGISYNRLVFFDKKSYKENFDKYQVRKGDLVIAMSGATTGKLAISDTDEIFYLNQRVGKFEPKKDLLKEYLYHFLSTRIEENLEMSAGSAQPNLSTEQIKNFEIPLPPIPEQHRIVKILDEVFENIAKAKENVEKNLQNSKDFFESYLQGVFTKQGNGWEKKRLGDVCDTGAGGTPLKAHRDYYENGTIPWLRSGEVCKKEITKTELFITEKGFKNSSASLFPKNSVLVAMYGATAGQTGILRVEATTNQAVCGILPNKDFLSEFIYYFFSANKQDLVKQAVGGAQPNISQIKIKNTFIPILSISEQKSIVTKLDALSEQTKKLEEIYKQKLADLEELKKSVLKKAFSGEL